MSFGPKVQLMDPSRAKPDAQHLHGLLSQVVCTGSAVKVFEFFSQSSFRSRFTALELKH